MSSPWFSVSQGKIDMARPQQDMIAAGGSDLTLHPRTFRVMSGTALSRLGLREDLVGWNSTHIRRGDNVRQPVGAKKCE